MKANLLSMSTDPFPFFPDLSTVSGLRVPVLPWLFPVSGLRSPVFVLRLPIFPDREAIPAGSIAMKAERIPI
jgi:hypothetical protein